MKYATQIFCTILLFFALFFLLSHKSLASYNGYAFERQININSSKVSPITNTSTLANFPILVSVTIPDLMASSLGGSIENVDSSGRPLDLIFSPTAGCTASSTGWEIENYNPATGELEAWVNNGAISPSSGLTFYMCYGNSSVTSFQGSSTAVWDANYQDVYHLKEATGTNAADSTSNATTATQQNSPIQTAGQDGGSLSFNGSNQYLDVGSKDFGTPLTLEAWVNLQPGFSNGKAVAGKEGRFRIMIDSSGSNTIADFVVGTMNNSWYSAGTTTAGTTNLQTGTWYQVVGVYDGTYVRIYVNGVQEGIGSQAISGGFYSSANHFTIAGSSAAFLLKSLIDEVRISNTARSADWIATEYDNQSNPSDFLTIGPLQTAGSGGTPSPPQNFTAISAGSTATLSWSAPAANGDSNLTQYAVMERVVGATSFVQVATTSPEQTSISLTGFITGQAYIFAVAAENGQGTSDLSLLAAPTFQPGTPTGVTATVLPRNSVATVTTMAGVAGSLGIIDGTGSTARLHYPKTGFVDSKSNYYFSDLGVHTSSNHEYVRKMAPDGTVTTIAGSSANGYVNGNSTTAEFQDANMVTMDSSGNLYVADGAPNCVIRKITPDGIVSLYAGIPQNCGSTDGPLGTATLSTADGLITDKSGNIFFADYGLCIVRKITPVGMVSTVAGVPGDCHDVDGTALGTARFGHLAGIGIDSVGNIFVVDEYPICTIRKITPDGMVATVAGLAGNCVSVDGTGSGASFYGPSFLTIDAYDNLYVTEYRSDTIRRITPDGVVTTIAGAAGTAGSSDGIGATALVNGPDGIAIDSSGNIYFSDQLNSTIRKAVLNNAATVNVSFTMDPNLTGGGVTGYTVTSDPAGGIDENSGSLATTHTMAGLTNDGSTHYTFTVTATNAAGTSVASMPSNSVLAAIVPFRPALTSSHSSASILLSWNPAYNGGSAITQYDIYSRPTGTSSFSLDASVPATQTTFSFSPPDTEKLYDFEVMADNAIGDSAPSIVVTDSVQPPKGSGGLIAFVPPPTAPEVVPVSTPAIAIPTRNTSQEVTTPPPFSPPAVEGLPVQTEVPVVKGGSLGIVSLRQGSKGEDVKTLQTLLNKAFNLNLKVDGILGTKTITIVKKWQKSHGLKADGIVGPKTKGVMEKLIK